MIYIYYTGADNFKDEQKNPIKSLGGFVSSSLVPKDFSNNLFGDISNFTLQKNSLDFKCIALKNQSNDTIKNLNIYFETSLNSLFDYEIAPVAQTIDECGNILFEKIPNSESSPYYGEFYKPYNEENKINVGDLNKDEYLGIFIKRKIKSLFSNAPCINYNSSNVEEYFKLIFIWD